MRLAHVADLHFGLGYAGPSPDSRFQDICKVADWMADKMIQERVDVVLVAGDLFKDSKVSLDRASVEITAAANWLRKLSGAGIHAFVISGTPSHDAIAAYALLKEMRIPLVTITTTPDTYVFRGLPIHCFPGVNKSLLASRDEYKNLSPQQLNQLLTDKITQAVMGMPAKVPGGILLSHITCAGADKGYEDLIMQQEPVLTAQAIDEGNFDLVCLGHIHRPQRVKGLETPTFYCGSPERLSFSDERITPGFWIHEIEEEAYEGSWFIETPARRYITRSYDVREYTAKVLERWYKELAHVDGSGAIIRLNYRAREEQSKLINTGEIRQRLEQNAPYYIAEIKAEIEKGERARAKGATAEMTPIDGLVLWCKVSEVPEDEAAELVALAEELEVA